MALVRRAVASAVVIACLSVTTSCWANLIEDVWGTVTDPFKLERGSKNIFESVIRLQQLMKDLDSVEVRTNADITARLRDVKEITDQVIAAVDRGMVVAQALVDRMEKLEADIFAKAEGLIEQFGCLVVNAMTEFDMELKNAALTIKAANPRITLFGIPVIKLATKEVRIDDPWQAYLSIASFHLAEIQNLTESSPAREFVHHYGEIVRLGKRAQCAYKGQPAAMWLEQRYIVPYKALQEPWVTVVHPM